MTWAIIVAIVSVAIAIGTIIYYHNKPAPRPNTPQDTELLAHLRELEEEISQKREKLAEIDKKLSFSEENKGKLLLENEKLKDELHEVEVSLASARAQDQELRRGYAEKNEMLEEDFKHKIEAIDKQYSELAEKRASDFTAAEQDIQAQYNELLTKLQTEQNILRVAQEQNRTDHEDEGRHYLIMSEVDIYEIKELMDVLPHLRNSVPLCKAIYDIYYKVPYTNLVNDLKVRGVCGIYKITNKLDGKIYIGQSVDIGERWKQHIKRGCGAEVGTISGSKLYSAMLKDGAWNFKFEVIQSCKRDELNSMEKHWISYFDSIQYGYNMKAGG